MNIRENVQIPYSSFYVSVTGAIQSGTMNDNDGVSCGFEFMSGTDWQIHSVSFNAINCFCRVMKLVYRNTRTKASRLIGELFGTSHLKSPSDQ